MTINYPDTLPVGLHNGRTYQLESPLQRTSLSSGRARQRRRFTNVPEYASISWLFNDAQGQAFEAWFRDAITDGAQWFECPLDTPLGFYRQTVRFTDIYTGPSRVGPDLWSYSAELEIRQRAVPPTGEGMFPDDIVYSEIFDLTINLEWPLATGSLT